MQHKLCSNSISVTTLATMNTYMPKYEQYYGILYCDLGASN